jgi:hypothetical protein
LARPHLQADTSKFASASRPVILLTTIERA